MKKSLRLDGLLKPPSVDKQLKSRGLHHACAQHEVSSFMASLRACAINKDLCTGTRLHDNIKRKGLLAQCSDGLVAMYAKCGSLAKAKQLFDLHRSRDVFTWNALIAAHAQKGQGQDALLYFERMRHEGLSPCGSTFSSILKACGSVRALDKGEQIHEEIAQHGLLENDIALGNALVSMYAKCGALSKARGVLEKLSARNAISWNAMITGCIEQGEAEQALNCFKEMQHDGLRPNAVTFICILKACGSLRAVEMGEKIHNQIDKQGLLRDSMALGTALVDMYAKCGDLVKAAHVLKELPTRNVISWNALIAGYAQHGQGEQAMDCLEQMQGEGISPDAVTFISMLKVCGIMGAADKGEEIHDKISKQGLLRNDTALGNALVDMYAKCGALAKAREVLEELPVRNVISWNAIITGYAQHGEGEQALHSFEQMKSEGLCPDEVTFICILKACGSVRAIDKGEEIHREIAKQQLRSNAMLGTALVDMYAKCGALTTAQEVLEELPIRDAISWSALIAGYAEQGECERALACFKKMQREGLCPNGVTFLCLLKACGSIGAVDAGERIHDEIAKLGLLKNDIALGNALVDMYVKCGAPDKAQEVLEELPSRNVISWSTLIAGYAQHGKGEQALSCAEQMEGEGFSPNVVTFVFLLKACGSIGAVDKGEKLHDEIAKQGLLKNDTVLGTALVDMYAACGAFAKALQVLQELPVRNAITWNALIAGSVKKGEGEQALYCFKQMLHEGFCPDAATFSSVLSACSRLGLVEDAQRYFGIMSTSYGLKPDVEHYTCMIHLFGRVGHLSKAVGMIEKTPSFDTGVWAALLAACLKWGNVKVGRWAFDRAVQLDKTNAVFYVFMAKIYRAVGMIEESEYIEAMKVENKAQKKLEQRCSIHTGPDKCPQRHFSATPHVCYAGIDGEGW